MHQNMDNPAFWPKLEHTAPAVMSGYRPHVHAPRPLWVAEVVFAGEYEIQVDGADWMRLGPRDGVLYRPGTGFQERVPAGVCRSYYAIFSFDDACLEQPLGGGKAVCRLRDAERLLFDCLESLQATGRGGALDQLARHSLLCRMIWFIAAAEPRQGALDIRQGETPGVTLASQVELYLRRHLKDRCRIEDIARHVGLSPSGLQHAYRRETGESPAKVLRRIRIERAKAMILRGGMTLETIASETGFGDGCHLSRAFKAHAGVSPRQYRAVAKTVPVGD